MTSPQRTIVYVDGFNLYHGCLKGSPYRWLDLLALSRNLLAPTSQIDAIRYYTARISARTDPDGPVRQDTYLRALRTIPCLSITLGHFLVHQARMACVTPPPRFIEVWKTEEKGSDVNLGAHLVRDACRGALDVAVLITNDSDLFEPARIVRDELGLRVGIVNPHPHRSRKLAQVSTFYRQVRTGVLAASQFPSTLRDAAGTFHKPAVW